MDIITYAKSKTYTNETAEEFGGLKGANCTIKSIAPISGGNRVTFEWENTSGATQEGTLDVMDGVDGNDGLGIKSVAIDANNHLIITYDDDTTEDAGEVTTVKGDKGDKGDRGDTGVGVPEGGTAGQVLVKKSSTDYDTEWDTPVGGGDMLKSVYDTDNDGKVDSAENADTVDGHTVAKDVPADAKFTDTVYDDTEIRGEIDDKVDKVSGKGLSTEDYTSEEKTKLAGVEAGAEVNTIESITLNGTEVTPDANKNIALTVITNAVNDLVNYYLKSETYTKTEVDDIVTAIKNSRFEVVATLPTTDIKTNVIYLVPKSPSQTSNVKDEYINLDGTTAGWEKIGDTEIDLSGYVTTQALNAALAAYTTTSDLTTLLAGKQDTLTFDDVPTENSNNPVKSGGVYSANQNIYEVMGANGAKNLLPNIGASNTINGITYTVNEDGSVTADGTATSNSEFILIQHNSDIATEFKQNIIGKTLTLSGCPNGGGSSKYHVRKWGQGSSGTYYDQGNGVTFTPTLEEYDSYTWNFQIRIMSGTTVSNLLFKPMLRLASDTDNTYQPYAKTNQQLTQDKAEQAEVNDIVNVYGGKNLLPFDLADIIANNTAGTWSGKTFTQTGSTLKFTLNDDGSITVSGTANSSATATLFLYGKSSLAEENDFKGMILSGCPSGGTTNGYSFVAQGFDTSAISSETTYRDFGSGITIGDKDYLRVYVRVQAGVTVDNLTFYPMIRLASIEDDIYEPYAKTNQQLTKDSVTWDNISEVGAVNYLENKGTTQVDATTGLTFTVNDDKSVTVSATSGTYPHTVPSAKAFIFNSDSCDNLKDGKVYRLSGCPSGGGSSSYYIAFYQSGVVDKSDQGDGYVFAKTASMTSVLTQISIKANTVLSSAITFYPMITPVSYNGDYVPYAKSNKELTEDVESIESDITSLLNTVNITKVVQWNTYYTDGASPADYSALTTQQATDIAQGLYDLMKKLFGTTSTGCRIIQVDRLARDASGTQIGHSQGLAFIQMVQSYNTMLSNNDNARFSIMFLPYGVSGFYSLACWGKTLRVTNNVQSADYADAHGGFTYNTISSYKG